MTGLTLVFFSGGVLWFGLWPWPGGPKLMSSERLVFWLTALYTLISATIGGAAGAYFGNGFEVFLAEDVLREGHYLGQRAIVAHLHVMLTLIDVMLLLVVARLFKLDGTVGRITCAMIAVSSTIASFATWSILVTAEAAHKLINAGAFLLLAAGGILAFWGFTRLIRK